MTQFDFDEKDEEGYLYIDRNVTHAENIFKVGISNDPLRRADELSRPTGVADKFFIFAKFFVKKMRLAEKLFKYSFFEHRFGNKELYQIETDELIRKTQIIVDLVNNIVCENEKYCEEQPHENTKEEISVSESEDVVLTANDERKKITTPYWQSLTEYSNGKLKNGMEIKVAKSFWQYIKTLSTNNKTYLDLIITKRKIKFALVTYDKEITAKNIENNIKNIEDEVKQKIDRNSVTSIHATFFLSSIDVDLTKRENYETYNKWVVEQANKLIEIIPKYVISTQSRGDYSNGNTSF